MRALSRSALLGLAAVPLLAQRAPGPPPISSQLPDVQEERRARAEVVPPARSEAEMRELALVPQTYEGKLIDADPRTRTLSIATEDGPERIQLSRDASISVDGQPVDNFAELPEGEDVRASLNVTHDAELIELEVVDTQSGPGLQDLRRESPPVIEP